MSNRREFAKSLLENPEFLGLIEELRDHQFAVIAQSPVEGVKQREGAYALLRAMGELVSLLESYAQAGAHERAREAAAVMTGTQGMERH